MLFNPYHHPTRTLEHKIQREVGKQSIWGLGNNSDERMNLFSRLYVPPENIISIDFFLSFEFSTYNSVLLIKENGVANEREIARFILSANNDNIVSEFEAFMKYAVTNYDHKIDRGFERKIREIIAGACILEREGYRKAMIAMLQNKSS